MNTQVPSSSPLSESPKGLSTNKGLGSSTVQINTLSTHPLRALVSPTQLNNELRSWSHSSPPSNLYLFTQQNEDVSPMKNPRFSWGCHSPVHNFHNSNESIGINPIANNYGMLSPPLTSQKVRWNSGSSLNGLERQVWLCSNQQQLALV